jgi:hypothetical protein
MPPLPCEHGLHAPHVRLALMLTQQCLRQGKVLPTSPEEPSLLCVQRILLRSQRSKHLALPPAHNPAHTIADAHARARRACLARNSARASLTATGRGECNGRVGWALSGGVGRPSRRTAGIGGVEWNGNARKPAPNPTLLLTHRPAQTIPRGREHASRETLPLRCSRSRNGHGPAEAHVATRCRCHWSLRWRGACVAAAASPGACAVGVCP